MDWQGVLYLLQSLVYSNDGLLMSGPLDSLVLHLVPTGQYYPEVCCGHMTTHVKTSYVYVGFFRLLKITTTAVAQCQQYLSV